MVLRDAWRQSFTGLTIDLFAGGGGASTGIEAALGRPVDIAINHDAVALAVHRANHPRTLHVEEDIWRADPGPLVAGRPVALLWASPDCTHFSMAKGAKPRSQKLRTLAWAVVRWAKATRPAVIFLENVTEFQGWGPLKADGTPDRRFMGKTFRAWRRRLERLGYEVDVRVLDASLYGAPTRRRRLFIIARSDGQPIRWPAVTHGPGKRPLHTAAEIIDWSLPCPSIFERKRPLAAKTLWRIARGIDRFVVKNPRPFLVPSHPRQLGAPFLTHVAHGKLEGRSQQMTLPLGTITAQRRSVAVAVPTLIQVGYGEREGQDARVPGLEKPLGTVVAGGRKHALVAATLLKHFGGVVGHEVDRAIGTITARDHHSLAAATLVKLWGTGTAADVELPLPTVTSGGSRGGGHLAEVRAFLTKYYSTGSALAQDLRDPLHTILSKERFGLVTVEGSEYAISDIGMRMLEPHELLAGQFGRYARDYDLTAAKTKAAKVRLIGNSVCPDVAEAIVRANVEPAAGVAAA